MRDGIRTDVHIQFSEFSIQVLYAWQTVLLNYEMRSLFFLFWMESKLVYFGVIIKWLIIMAL